MDPDNGPIQFGNLSESPASCVDNGDGTSTLTITGMCPFKKGNTLVGATGSGTIDCRGRDASGNLTGVNPTFCGYAGTNPVGNTTGDCRWNMGFGALKSNGDVELLTQTQCQTAFPVPNPNPDNLVAGQVFKFTQRYSAPGCTGTEFAGVGATTERFCHSDTWDGSKPAACTFPQGGGAKNTVLGKLASHLTIDTEYQPTVSPNCGPQNSGIVNLTVFAVNRDPDHPDNNTVALELINQKTITVNGNSVAFKNDGTPACAFDVFPNPNVMTCNIKKCVNGHNIIDPNQISDGTSTLVMRASMLSDGSPIEGDIETVNVSGNAP